VTSERGKVLVAMSGGVDSSVAASLLLQAGWDVTGAFMCLGSAGQTEGESRGCCSPADAADARRVAQTLGIEMFVLNLADAFEPIIADFAAEYARGRTPNPCIHCNRLLKFGRLLERAASVGIDYVATGHYARIVAGPAVARGAAREKDQSYALFSIPREALSRIVLPIGEIADKDEVRSIARSLGLNVHDKPDSQEICFAPDDDYAAVLQARAAQALTPGDIVNAAGDVLGTHEGYARFTIGQRRGLGVAAGEPMYVTKIDPATATVTIGPRDEVMSRELTASNATWHAETGEQFRATVQVRYNHPGSPATVRVTGPDTFEADFDEPVHAITPGQAAVVYDTDNRVLLGGGWIEGSD